MALTPTGEISLGDMNVALGRGSTASISIGDSQVRFIANQDSGEVSMSSMQNKYNFNGTITVGTFNPGFGYDVYGYDSDSSTGSITGGPLWDDRSIGLLSATTIPNTAIGTFDLGDAFPDLNMRIKVGNNSAISMEKTAENLYNNLTTAAIVSADVGSTLNWQFSQT